MSRTQTTRAAAAFVLLALLTPGARAETEPSTLPPGGAPPEVQATTDVRGKVPQDIVGRWLAVCQVKLPSGQVRPVTRLFEVRKGSEHLELVLGGDVPSPVNQKLNAAANAGQPWTPTVEDLRETDEKWGPLTLDPNSYAKVEYRLLGGDAFPPDFAEDETTKGSRFAIAVKENFSRGQAAWTYWVFGVRDQTPTVLSGTALISTLAIAPLPVPITFKGEFQAYRLAEPSPRSLVQRLLDLFSGCRR